MRARLVRSKDPVAAASQLLADRILSIQETRGQVRLAIAGGSALSALGPALSALGPALASLADARSAIRGYLSS